MVRKKDIDKLAQLIKIAAKDVSKEEAWWKTESNSEMLGLKATDEGPNILEVKDDSGYRAIILGDTRGNVSLNTGKLNNSLSHKGYALLYTDNSSRTKDDKRVWDSGFRCFPPTKTIAEILLCIVNKEPLGNIRYYVGDDKDLTALYSFLSDVVIKYAEIIGKDTRTAQEIFDSSQ